MRLRPLPRLALRSKVLPPMTGVDPEPKLHGPPAVTRDWYSLRHTLKYVSHSSREHLRSPGFREPPQPGAGRDAGGAARAGAREEGAFGNTRKGGDSRCQ